VGLVSPTFLHKSLINTRRNLLLNLEDYSFSKTRNEEKGQPPVLSVLFSAIFS
jgi:hypothetical protein